MIFYRFHEKGGTSVVITSDITGSNLPRVEGGWAADGRTEIQEGRGKRFGVDAGEIIATIQQAGYYMGAVRNA
jgi:hypothetical protein